MSSQRRRRARRLVVHARHRAQQPRQLADVGVELGVQALHQALLAHLAVLAARRPRRAAWGCRRPPCPACRPAPGRRRPASSASRPPRGCPRSSARSRCRPASCCARGGCRWCSSSTSVIVRSGQPAAAMQRTAQRENAFQATIRPNSNSDSSTLRGDTRCDDDTMPRRRCGAAARLRRRVLRGIGVFTQIVEDLLTIYRQSFSRLQALASGSRQTRSAARAARLMLRTRHPPSTQECP